MFTGLVETLGEVVAVSGTSPRRLVIRSQLPVSAIAIGASIAIDGCCLTVVEKVDQDLHFEAATETLLRTTLGGLRVRQHVNLEQAMRLDDRLGGHLVSGHVDGVGQVVGREQRESALYVSVKMPDDVAPLVAPRGSVTLAGVSLTVVDAQGAIASVGLIPHTLKETTLGTYGVGDPINVEADLLARYVARLMQAKVG